MPLYGPPTVILLTRDQGYSGVGVRTLTGPVVRPSAVGDRTAYGIVGSPWSQLSNPAEIAEKPFRATLLAEPFPWTVTQGVILLLR